MILADEVLRVRDEVVRVGPSPAKSFYKAEMERLQDDVCRLRASFEAQAYELQALAGADACADELKTKLLRIAELPAKWKSHAQECHARHGEYGSGREDQAEHCSFELEQLLRND
jgi:hypothetical protein